jgi:methylenetetrahydrofolate reductase (NADPH)
MNTSFEFFPPKTEKGKENLVDITRKLSNFLPEYFSVTYGAGGSTREGTLETCVSIMNLGQKAYPHLSGIGASKASVKEILSDYKEQALTRIVTLRGDLPSGIRGGGDFPYALDLIKFIKKEKEDFLIEVAAYPEVHPDAESENADFENFLNKVNAGADGAITQFFFQEDSYFKFMDKCEREQISIPVVPGIMPIHNSEALIRMAKACQAQIPVWLREGMEKFSSNEDLLAYGVDVITKLCEKLLHFGAPGIHFFTINREEPTSSIVKNLEIN